MLDAGEVEAFSIGTSNVTVHNGSVHNNQTGVLIDVRSGVNATLFRVSPVGRNISAGDIIGVTIIQANSSPDNQFGVNLTPQGMYPHSAFIYADGNTAYFKCLSSDCRTSTIGILKSVASYYVYGMVIHPKRDANGQVHDYTAALQELVSKVNESKTILGTVLERVSEIRNNTLDSKIFTFEINQTLKKINKRLEDEKKLEEQVAQQDNSGNIQQNALNNSGVSSKQSSVISAGAQILNAPASSCSISAGGVLPLELDFCSTPRPAFLHPLLLIASAMSGFYLSQRLLRQIFAAVQSFRSGL